MQEEDILIGCVILERADLAGKWYFFKAPEALDKVETTHSRFPLRNQQEAIIPPSTAHICKISSEGKEKISVFVGQGAPSPGLFVPQCVSWTNGYLPVITLS